MNEVLKQAIDWIDRGHGVALAGVVSTWGSSPRQAGSQLAINEKGRFVGSISGGCIESFVVSEAIDVIEDGEPQLLEYGVSDQSAQEVRLSCGGTVRVFVERAPPSEQLQRLVAREAVARVVDLDSGKSLIVDEIGAQGVLELDAETLEQVRGMLRRKVSGTLTLAAMELFVTSYGRPRRLIIIGAVHIAQVLAPMATAIGFDVVVVDSRPAFGRDDRLPGVTIIRQPTHKAMRQLAPDSDTSVVALAHDPILDDPALHAALQSAAAYIGCLGSRRTHAMRLDRLHLAGFAERDLARLHGPIGLDIGGRSPGEIAVSILAEIIAVASGKVKQ